MIPDDEYFVQWQGSAKRMIKMLKASDLPKEQELGALLLELTNAEDLLQPLQRDEPFALLDAIDYVQKALRFHSPEVEILQAPDPSQTLFFGDDMDEGEEPVPLDGDHAEDGTRNPGGLAAQSNHAVSPEVLPVFSHEVSLLDDVETYAPGGGEHQPDDARSDAAPEDASPVGGGADHLFDEDITPEGARHSPIAPATAPATVPVEPPHDTQSVNAGAHGPQERERILAERERVLAERERVLAERERDNRATQRAVVGPERGQQTTPVLSRTASVHSRSTPLLSRKASLLSRTPSAHPSAASLAVSIPVGVAPDDSPALSSPLTPQADTNPDTTPAFATEVPDAAPSERKSFNADLPPGQPNSRGLIRRAMGTRRLGERPELPAVSPRRSQRRRGGQEGVSQVG